MGEKEDDEGFSYGASEIVITLFFGNKSSVAMAYGGKGNSNGIHLYGRIKGRGGGVMYKCCSSWMLLRLAGLAERDSSRTV